jgi:hypothetical protein
MLATLAWRAMSFGARSLYVALKGQSSNTGNLAYLSYRKAANELGIKNLRKIAEWFRELEHYGFIVMHRHGSLGVEGRGKAPQWRLTEKSASPPGELATRDYLRWDGELFEPSRSLNRLSSLPLRSQKPNGHPPMVNLDMSHTRSTGEEPHMLYTRSTVEEGTVVHAVNTPVVDAVNGVLQTRSTGFCFSGVTRGVNTSGDDHELASRFLAALSPKD